MSECNIFKSKFDSRKCWIPIRKCRCVTELEKFVKWNRNSSVNDVATTTQFSVSEFLTICPLTEERCSLISTLQKTNYKIALSCLRILRCLMLFITLQLKHITDHYLLHDKKTTYWDQRHQNTRWPTRRRRTMCLFSPILQSSATVPLISMKNDGLIGLSFPPPCSDIVKPGNYSTAA